jgi:two-component system OmpR family response regulator
MLVGEPEACMKTAAGRAATGSPRCFPPMRLLLLEDDDILGDGLTGFLCADGHQVDWYRRLDEVKALHHEPYDAFLVDWQLPDGSGLDWVQALRRHGVTAPILVLTARDLLADRIHGLDSGADDYLVKPFAPEELAARIRSVARRAASGGAARLNFGEVEVDMAQRAVYLRQQRVELTAREWALLEALALRAGRIVSRPELETLVLGGQTEVASNAIEVHLSSLRRKLGREIVATVRGLGYRIDK